MCTIIAAFRVRPDLPLVVAANRDELYQRPATAPRLLDGAPDVVAGVDLVKGGTWMGATRAGFFVGLTNQRSWFPVDRAFPVDNVRSRGEICAEALRLGETSAVEAYLEGLNAGDYNEFNLLFGDGEGLRVAYGRRQARGVEVHALAPGVHVLANARLGSPEFPKAERAKGIVTPALQRSWEQLLDTLVAALSDRQLPTEEQLPTPPAGSRFGMFAVRELQAMCLHTPFYGTVSATIAAFGPDRVEAYLHAAGKVCEVPLVDYASLLRGPGGGT